MSTVHDRSQPRAKPAELGRVYDSADEPKPRSHAYTKPALERLGAWRALTLQQSVPIGMFGLPADGGIRDVDA